jgi:hypothetical protein
MSVPSISDLLQPPDDESIQQLLLAYIAIASNPVTDFEDGAVQKTMWRIESQILSDLLGPGASPDFKSMLYRLLSNGYPDSATGDSLTTLADGCFEVERNLGAFAIQTVTLACDASHGPYTFTAGLQEALGSDGKVYVAATGGLLSPADTLVLDFDARAVGLAKALITQLAQPLPGVTVQSAAIKVISLVPQFGADADSDATIQAACLARFPDPGFVPTQDRVVTWALAAGTSTTRTRLDPDPSLAGGVILTVANATGPVSSGDVTTIAAYVLARQPITDNLTVQNATAANITPGGTATVSLAQLATIQAAAEAAWVTYLSASKIGAQVYLLELIQAVMDAGATNFVAPTLNGSSADVVLTSGQVPVESTTLIAGLTWITVG